MKLKSKTRATLLIAMFMISTIAFAIPVFANTVESSTMHFEGELTLDGNGNFIGVIPMTAGYYADLYPNGGSDIYAKEGATAFSDWGGYVSDVQLIGEDHDAFPVGGTLCPEGYTPDILGCSYWELELTSDHWCLRQIDLQSPMSGTLTWYKDGTGYAEETDLGTIQDPSVDEAALIAHGGGAQTWDFNLGPFPGTDYPNSYFEVIPLEYPGFVVEITNHIVFVEGVQVTYQHVTLTPSERLDSQGIFLSAGTDRAHYVLLTIAPLGEGTITRVPDRDKITGYYHGELVTLTADAFPGFVFVEWQEGGIGISTANPMTISMLSDRTITATFEPLPVVSIDVTPNDLDFGPIIAGIDTPTQPVTITNTGNIDVTVGIALTEDTSHTYGTGGYFYADYLRVGGDPVPVTVPVPEGPATVISVGLETLPGDFPAGAYEGKLVFTATAPPP